MKSKILIYMAAALIAFAGCFAVYELTESSDAVTEYPVTIFYNPNATIVFDGNTVTSPNSSEAYGYGDQITITATLASGYTFDHWHGYNVTEGEPWDAYSSSSDITISGNVVTYTTWCYGEEEYTLYLNGAQPTYTLTFIASPSNYGYMNMDSAPSAVGNTLTLEYGTQFYIAGDGITFYTSPYAQWVYAEPWPDSGGSHYYFSHWGRNEGSYIVTGNATIYGYFAVEPATYKVLFNAGNGGSVSSGNISSIPYNSAIQQNGNQITINNQTITATPDVGYEFSSWSNASGNVTANRTITANFTQIQTYSVTINHNSAYGYVTQSTLFNNVPAGTIITASGNTLTVGNIGTATATAKSPSTTQTFRFDGWTIPSATLSGNMTVTANFSATYKDFPVTVYYHPHATIVFDGVTVTSPNSSEEYGYGDPITITATLDQGYVFDHWYGNNLTEGESWTADSSSQYVTISGNVVTYRTWCYGNEEYTLYLTGGPVTSHTITFKASPLGYGTMSNNSVTAQYGATWYIDGDKFYVDGQLASRAVPASSDLSYNYSFDSWSYLQQSGTVTEDMTVTAYFIRTPVVQTEGVGWTNGSYNGTIELLFKFGGSNIKSHTMTMDLYEGRINADQQTNWTPNGYSLEIVQHYISSSSITATLKYHGTTVSGMTATVEPGKWSSWVLTIDTDNGKIYVTPVKKFNSFVDYTLYDTQKREVLDFSSKVKSSAVLGISHTESDDGVNSPQFSVVGTMVFLNTFGVVMTNPSINVASYFPDYEKVRLNFYSFALYGDLMNVNGKNFPVDEGTVTVYYYTDIDKINHWVASMDSPTPENPYGEEYVVRSKTFTLSNIYVTWNGDTCSLTFVNDKFTVDLGIYSAGNETVSFAGFWYFTTTLYEPITVTEKSLDGSWKAMPDIGGPAMILLYLGTLLGLGLIAHVKLGLKWLDLTILAIGLVLGFTLLG